MRNISLLLSVFALSCFLTTQPNPNHIEFDVAMQTSKYPESIKNTQHIVGIDGNILINFLRDLYNKNSLSNITPSEKPRIPKIIHHIWLGGEVPNVLQKYIDSAKKIHPKWQYKLWTDKDVSQMKLYNREIFDQTTNCGAKSDILRYEILYRYGGVYLDTDMECLKPLDILHKCYDFYIGIQPLSHDLITFGTGAIGSIPGHPILKHLIKSLPKNFRRYKMVTQQTGPIPATISFYLESDKGTIDIALPANYFYPIDAKEKNIDKEKCKKRGAFCIHWWAKTWCSIIERKKEFQAIENNSSL